MAITNISTGFPAFHPAYNPCVYMFDSTNKTEPGFRYIVDVYPAGSSTKVGEFRVSPRPGDGYGYIDLSKFLQTLMSQDFSPTNTTSFAAAKSYYQYDVKIGEEYVQGWDFADTSYAFSGPLLGNTVLGPVGGTAGTGPIHPFSVGDQVIIDLDDPTLFPGLEGLHGIDAVPNQYTILVDVPFVSSPANPGRVRFADNRPQQDRDLFTYSSRTAFNGAIKWNQWPTYSESIFKLDTLSTVNRTLTNMPTTFKASPTQDIWVNIATARDPLVTRLWVVNSLGNVYFKTINNVTLFYIHQVSVGPNNIGTLTQSVGTPASFLDGAEWYDYYIGNSTGQQITRTYRIQLDRRCPIESYEILFLDRLGSLASYSFYLRSTESGNITRTSFNQQVGDLSTNRWNYSVQDRGEVISDISVTKEFNLNTQWMDHVQNIYFEELLTSPFTFIKIAGAYQPCTVQDTTYQVQSQTLRKLITRSINVKIANENPINV